VYVEEARRTGVAILPPDVNRSELDCTVERKNAALRIGLGLVKGLSGSTLEALFAARAADGAFLSLPDFLERTGAHTDEAESLIQCGAFDAFDHTRPELSWRLHLLRSPKLRPPREVARTGGRPLDPDALAACEATPESRTQELLRAARAKSGGWRAGGSLALGSAPLAPGEQASLFAPPETPALALPSLPDISRAERGAIEHELLGLTVRDHPTRVFPCPAEARIAALAARLKPRAPIDCAALERFQGGRVGLRGWPAASRRVVTSKGEWMRFLTLEDESGLAEVVVFPDVYQRDGHRLAEFGTLFVTGVVQNQMGACTLQAERIW
jgi:DNA polymerase III alpha subunit